MPAFWRDLRLLAGRGAGGSSLPSGQPSRRSRSGLLAVASGSILAVLLLLVLGIATLASAHVAASAISASAAADRSLAVALLEQLGADATAPPQDARATLRLGRELQEAVDETGVLGMALIGPDAHLWASAGQDVAVPEGALEPGRLEARATLVERPDGPRLVEIFPVRLEGRAVATLVVLRDGTTAAATAAAAQRDVALAAGAGATVVIMVAFLIFRSAQRRLDEQTRQLVEAERHDPLTGSLTYGAALAELGTALDAGLQPIAVALVDIDNFGRLNETHGYELGDDVIRQVAARLAADAPPGVRIGRSGPDEFLLVCPSTDASTLVARLADLNHALVRTGVDTESGDALPLSVSAGIAVAPLHGRTVTELVSAAALTLGEAKSGGGGSIIVSRLSYADLVAEHRATFSVLDGLVNAIDARDRYTRRHSEDVARYALFLAGQLGLDAAFCEALHHAALLHDVGKIAVPDDVLRKPAALTTTEFEVMQQHPVLGGALVRDLNAADVVSDGVRHHHERWDGQGYPDGLAGEAIPLIARIIAVADAYSAMTTARPYRRALSRAVALQRLSAAAGTQLDPRLVDVFILAMESEADPPLPSDARAPAAWLVEGDAA